MPSLTSQPVPLPKWARPAKTKYDLEWASLSAIDLSKFDEPGGRQSLADQLREAVRKSCSCPILYEATV